MAEFQWGVSNGFVEYDQKLSGQEQTKMCLPAEHELNLISSLSANAWKLLKRRRWELSGMGLKFSETSRRS